MTLPNLIRESILLLVSLSARFTLCFLPIAFVFSSILFLKDYETYNLKISLTLITMKLFAYFANRKNPKQCNASSFGYSRYLLRISGMAIRTFYNQYALILQTGLRVGEMIGLKWSDVDIKNRVIHVRRTMECRNNTTGWRISEPKTVNSIRDIPLTSEAVEILKEQKQKLRSLKIMHVEWTDMVFLNQDGMPVKNNSYDAQLSRCCKKAGLPRFSMHILRHTFATRCIEAGMKPKTLQMILGHSSIAITMNLYVHVTDDEKRKELEEVESMLKLVFLSLYGKKQKTTLNNHERK